MATHDYAIANDSGANVRADINDALAAIQSQNSGSSAPSDTAAHMIYADTTKGHYRRRNSADSGWLPFAAGASTMVQAKSANYTVAAGDFGTLIACTSTFTLTLTAAATLGDGFWFEAFNAGTGIITIDGDSSETINGATTIILYPGDSAIVWCSGTAFYALRGGVEESTWTPALNFGGAATGITYGTQLGSYTRVGRLVTCFFQIVLTDKGSATGGATISGLPYATKSDGPNNGAGGLVTNYASMSSLTGPPLIKCATASSVVSLLQFAAAAPTAVQDTNFGDTSEIHGSFHYYI